MLRIIGGKGRSTSKPKTNPGPKGVVFHTKNDSKGNRWNLGPFLGLGCGASTHSIDLRFPPIQVVKLDGEIVETRELLELKYYYDQLKELLESEGFELVEEYGYYDKCSIDKGKEMILVCRKADHS